jgi:mRNA interferase RelE/StbE
MSDDLPNLNRNIKSRIRAAIEGRLARAPQDYGKPLRGELHPLWSLRVGDYRVLYLIEVAKVRVLQIVHRSDAYKAGVLEARQRGWL